MMSHTTLTAILNEKDVENFYRQYLTKKFGDIVFNSPFGCDGYGESKKHNIKLLCEFKDNLDLTSKVNQVKVLSQVLYYIKKFEVSGKILPSVILIGDRNECFTIHTNEIFNYLGMDFNWYIAPSNAHTNVELVTLMMEDNRINPHVFNIKDIANCVDKIKDLTDGVKRFIPITPHNVTEVFKHFEDNVIGSHKLDTNQMANLFVQLLVNPDDNYLHPVARRKTVVTKAFREVNLKSREVFESFFSHFSREYTPQQKEHLTAVVDRLVQDITRRKQGEFFTPTIWVDKAYEYITSVYGEDWKEKYVVWDCSWGTGNLTRDYKFNELYVSTLNYSDIQTADQMGYNPEAIKFQFDFLNDPYEYLPEGLQKAIESGRKIIVLINPPYATSNVAGNKGLEKTGTSQTKINKEMKSEDVWGKSTQQLYAQFLYRINKMKLDICLFSKPNFMTGSSFKKFRKEFFKNYEFKNGFVMDSAQFADVESWPLTFTIFSNTKNPENIFKLDIINYKDYQMIESGSKIFYNNDYRGDIQKWLKSNKKNPIQVYWPTKNGVEVSNTKGLKDTMMLNSMGYFYNNSNCIQYNSQGVAIFSTVFGSAHGIEIMDDNLINTSMMMSARQLIKPTWINEKDEYMVPTGDTTNFGYDSIILSLFSNGSYQTSLRDVEYNSQTFKVINQFFWMSKNEMVEISNQNNYNELHRDAVTDSDRYVHTLLFGEEGIYNQLSDEAKDVLDSATNLVKLSFGMRRNFADDTNHLNSWDAGYAQLKLLWKEYYPEQFKEFRAKYKVLEDKMRPMVYELGFLLK